MAIRKDIVFTVAEDGLAVLPAQPQDGGVQGEDKAVRVKFRLGAGHPLVTGGYQLYVECFDTTGGYDKTEVLIPDEEGAIAVEVPLAWTQYGGTISLNVAAEKDGEQRIITDSGRLSFRARAGMLRRMQSLIQTYIQKLLNRAETAIVDAEEAAGTAKGSAAEALEYVQSCYRNQTGAANHAAAAANAATAADVAASKAITSAGEAEEDAIAAANAADGAAQQAALARTAADEAKGYKSHAATSMNRCREIEVDCEIYADDAKQAADRAEAAAGAAGGGMGTVVVTVENGVPSHNGGHIYDEFCKGKTIVLLVDSTYYAMESASKSGITFIKIGEDYHGSLYEICGNSVNKTAIELVSANHLREVIGDIDTALDSIIAAQESLIGGDA